MHHVKLAATSLHVFEANGNVGFLHKAVMQHRAEEAVAHILKLAAFVGIDIGHIGDLHRQDHHTLVQHLVVLDIVEQR